MDSGRAGEFWVSSNGMVQCRLCPRRCRIPDGQSGFCGVRANRGGQLVLPYYGVISALNVDPVEKKPLYHFYPGHPILSVGFFGCSFDCPFCQNWTISRRIPFQGGFDLAPEDLAQKAVDQNLSLIAFTYSEPLVHWEYLFAAMGLARLAGLKSVLVTNGMIEPEPAERLLPLTDALNIDLKGFDADWYRKTLKGDLDAVCRFIVQAAAVSHVEITTLLIPGENDNPDELDRLARFIASVDPSIPWHVSAYRPEYRFRVPATTSGALARAVEIGRRHLDWVYTGNLGDDNDTLCPRCGRIVVRRNSYRVDPVGWENGRCRYCGTALT